MIDFGRHLVLTYLAWMVEYRLICHGHLLCRVRVVRTHFSVRRLGFVVLDDEASAQIAAGQSKQPSFSEGCFIFQRSIYEGQAEAAS
jgi:hypothetical protein